MTLSAAPGPGTGHRAGSAGSRPDPRGPHADCTADTAGGLTFDITPGAGERRWEALLLQRRGGDTPDDTVHLPLSPVEGGRLRAVLPGTVQLAEGRWNVSVTAGAGTGEPVVQRLLPGTDDLRTLVERVPSTGRSALGVCIPYTTKYGNLSLHTWLRRPHAEAGEIRIADGGITVHGRLHGAELGDPAWMEAHPRGGSATGFPVVRIPLLGKEQHFTAALPCGELAAAVAPDGSSRPEATPDPMVWDLWLRPADPAVPVRIARILDDVHDKSQVYRYPPLELPGATVAPFYTGDNDLALRLKRTG